jgi:hypothetical protein
MLSSATFELPQRVLARIDVLDFLLSVAFVALTAMALSAIEPGDFLFTLALIAVWGYGFVVYAPLWNIIETHFRTAQVVAFADQTLRVVEVRTLVR